MDRLDSRVWRSGNNLGGEADQRQHREGEECIEAPESPKQGKGLAGMV